jgi:hypothetical protein
MKKRHIWRDYNGPGKPITEGQIEELLAEHGIYPRVNDKGEKYWERSDFEQAWKKLGIER